MAVTSEGIDVWVLTKDSNLLGIFKLFLCVKEKWRGFQIEDRSEMFNLKEGIEILESKGIWLTKEIDDDDASHPGNRCMIVIGGSIEILWDPFLHNMVKIIGLVELIAQLLTDKNVAIGSEIDVWDTSVLQELLTLW